MLSVFEDIPYSDRIIVALDCTRDEAIELAESLRGRAKWVKIGMTLYYACGPSIIAAFKQRGYNVFLDLKLHDIPFQIEGLIKNCQPRQNDTTANIDGYKLCLDMIDNIVKKNNKKSFLKQLLEKFKRNNNVIDKKNKGVNHR